jgi:hypothetical protein
MTSPEFAATHESGFSPSRFAARQWSLTEQTGLRGASPQRIIYEFADKNRWERVGAR